MTDVDWSQVRDTQEKIARCMDLMRELGMYNSAAMVYSLAIELFVEDPDMGECLEHKEQIEEILRAVSALRKACIERWRDEK